MDFEFQPTLIGDTVTVSPIREQDWDALFAVAADEALWAQHPASDRYQEPVFRQFFDDAIGCKSAFVIREKTSNDVIGSSRYNELKSDEIEIGWTFLARSHWGTSTNTEVKKLMLEHAFRFVGTVIFWVGDTNIRSRRAVEKLGAELRDAKMDRAGSPHVVYALHREQFAGNQAG